MRRGAGPGVVVGDRTVVPARLFAQLVSDRETVAVRGKQSLDSIYYEDFARFTAAIDQCLGDLPTVHKGEMATLMTPKFQTFGDVPLFAA